MFTLEQANYLIALEKKVELEGKFEEFVKLNHHFPFVYKFQLAAEKNHDYTFLYDIKQSSKNQYKFTLYFLEGDTKIGLLRVDYGGIHKNPEIATALVPGYLLPFTGKYFNYDEPHIHVYVEGYKTTMDWALPLKTDSFPVKTISNGSDIIDAFYEFNQRINIKTTFTIDPSFL